VNRLRASAYLTTGTPKRRKGALSFQGSKKIGGGRRPVPNQDRYFGLGGREGDTGSPSRLSLGRLAKEGRSPYFIGTTTSSLKKVSAYEKILEGDSQGGRDSPVEVHLSVTTNQKQNA